MAYEGKAAVLNEAGKDAEIIDITIDPPGPGEVLVKLAASGVCHTDLTVKNLNGNGMKFPIVLGHEGAGTVEAVGEGVTHLAPGDPVVIAYRAPCDQCPACRRGDPRHCYMALRPQPRIHRASDGALCSQVLRCGTFATRTVVHSKAADQDAGRDAARQGLPDRLRRRHRRGRGDEHQPVFPGAAVAVIGCGGVGPFGHPGCEADARQPDLRRPTSTRPNSEWAKRLARPT
jgi:S-(hydroxymethyl)mycothiol dehydrogenase